MIAFVPQSHRMCRFLSASVAKPTKNVRKYIFLSNFAPEDKAHFELKDRKFIQFTLKFHFICNTMQSSGKIHFVPFTLAKCCGRDIQPFYLIWTTKTNQNRATFSNGMKCF